MTTELDDLLKELKQEGNKITTSPNTLPPLPDVTDDNVNKYILDNAAKLVQLGLLSVESLQSIVSQSTDPEEVESFASLIRSVNDSLNTINKINIQNKKAKVSKELKEMDLQKQLPPIHQTNVLIATRDEIIRAMLNKSTKHSSNDNNVIDVESMD